MKSKFLSRKFLVTVISAVAGIVVAIIGHDELVQSVAACAMIVIPSIAYTITEGRLDAENIRKSGNAISQMLSENGKAAAAEIMENVTDIAEAAADISPGKEANTL